MCKRICSLVVTKASVVSEVMGSTPHGREYSRVKRRYAFNGRRHFRRQRDVCGDFVNLEDLPAQYSKVLIEIEFVYVCSQECECTCVVSVLVVLCNLKRKTTEMCKINCISKCKINFISSRFFYYDHRFIPQDSSKLNFHIYLWMHRFIYRCIGCSVVL